MPLRAEYPEEGELVVGTVTSIRNFGAFVKLDEYADREAFIHLSEVAAGWVKYIRDHIREGQKIVARVLRIDTSKNQIDLSLKRINDHQRREKIQAWKNEQRAMRLIEQVAQALSKTADEAVEQFGPVLIERYSSLFAAFEVASADPARFTKENEKAAWTTAFLKVARENIVPPHVTILGTLEVFDRSRMASAMSGTPCWRPSRSTLPRWMFNMSALPATGSVCSRRSTRRPRRR